MIPSTPFIVQLREQKLREEEGLELVEELDHRWNWIFASRQYYDHLPL